jgi:hypothetical protein
MTGTSEITSQIDEQLEALQVIGLSEDESIEIVGVGGGCLPPCVMSKLRQKYHNYRITCEVRTE